MSQGVEVMGMQSYGNDITKEAKESQQPPAASAQQLIAPKLITPQAQQEFSDAPISRNEAHKQQ